MSHARLRSGMDRAEAPLCRFSSQRIGTPGRRCPRLLPTAYSLKSSPGLERMSSLGGVCCDAGGLRSLWLLPGWSGRSWAQEKTEHQSKAKSLLCPYEPRDCTAWPHEPRHHICAESTVPLIQAGLSPFSVSAPTVAIASLGSTSSCSTGECGHLWSAD